MSDKPCRMSGNQPRKKQIWVDGRKKIRKKDGCVQEETSVGVNAPRSKQNPI